LHKRYALQAQGAKFPGPRNGDHWVQVGRTIPPEVCIKSFPDPQTNVQICSSRLYSQPERIFPTNKPVSRLDSCGSYCGFLSRFILDMHFGHSNLSRLQLCFNNAVSKTLSSAISPRAQRSNLPIPESNPEASNSQHRHQPHKRLTRNLRPRYCGNTPRTSVEETKKRNMQVQLIHTALSFRFPPRQIRTRCWDVHLSGTLTRNSGGD
jgi:hypothetical protein